MSYSRRQLYAMGEPLGDGATRREVGGKIIYGGGGGGTPEKQTTVVDIPDWAKPYAKESLGKASALSATPYQAYGGERIAQFSPMQRQAFGRAEGQEVASQIGAGSGLAGTAGLMGLTGGYQPGQFGSQMSQYMSPYMDAVVQQQMDSAQRQADIASTQRGAQAVRAGAFGGSRQAIQDAEAARALASQKGQIQATGLQSAYDRATDMYGREQALAEQSRQAGLSTALGAAGQLGQLGQQQFGQQMDITGQQAQFGQQQRAATQDILSAQYQDFLNQQRAPYDQLAFMTSMIRGTPMGQTTTMYQPPPSQASQLIGLATAGAGAYGAYQGAQGRAAGGSVPSYAAGGIASLNQPELSAMAGGMSDAQLAQAGQSPVNPELAKMTLAAEAQQRAQLREQSKAMQAKGSMTNITSTLANMSNSELQQYAQMNKGDPYTMALVVAEANRRKEGGMPNQEAPTVVDQRIAGMALPEEMGIAQLPTGNMDFAGGGIIAFESGGYLPPLERYSQRKFAEEERRRLEFEAFNEQLRKDPAQVQMREAEQEFANMSPFEKSSERGRRIREFLRAAVSAPAAGGPGILPNIEPPATPAAQDRPRSHPLGGIADIKPQMPPPPPVQDMGAGRAPAPDAATAGITAVLPKSIQELQAKYRSEVEEAGKAGEKIEAERLAATKRDQEEMGPIGAEREKRNLAQEKKLEDAEGKNFNMALIEAGLAIMAGNSANAFENIGKGAMVGTKAYTTGMNRIQDRREKLDESIMALDELRYGDRKASKKELRDAEAAVNKAAQQTKSALATVTGKEADVAVDMYTKQQDARSRENVARIAAAGGAGGVGGENRLITAAENAFQRDPEAAAIRKQMESPIVANNPTKMADAIRRLRDIQAAKYKQFGITMDQGAAASSAADPLGLR